MHGLNGAPTVWGFCLLGGFLSTWDSFASCKSSRSWRGAGELFSFTFSGMTDEGRSGRVGLVVRDDCGRWVSGCSVMWSGYLREAVSFNG